VRQTQTRLHVGELESQAERSCLTSYLQQSSFFKRCRTHTCAVFLFFSVLLFSGLISRKERTAGKFEMVAKGYREIDRDVGLL
jgi:hypothetical protein